MTRVKRGNVARKRRKQILKLAKGFRGSHSTIFRTAKQQVLKALKYSYQGRKNKKRNYRRLWVVRINASLQPFNVTYSEFIGGLKQCKVGLNRKMLGQLAILDNKSFIHIVQQCLSV